MRLSTGSLCPMAALLLLAAAPMIPQQEQKEQAVAESARAFHFQVVDYITSSDHPNRFTQLVGINDAGVIVGNFQRMQYNCGNVSACGKGAFIYQSGKFHELNGPLTGHFTTAIAINNHGQILLSQQSLDVGSIVEYFVYEMQRNTFRPVGPFVTATGVPGTVRMNAINSFNDLGQFVGSYNFRGRLWSGYGTLTLGEPGSTAIPTQPATFMAIQCPDGRAMRAMAINNHGQITGSCSGGNKWPTSRGFVYSSGTVTLFDAPGAGITQGNSMNDAGAIVGDYTLRPLHPGLWPGMGFAYDESRFVPLAIHNSPGGALSDARGINNRGQIVGMDGDGNHGFVATPTTGNPLHLSTGR